MYAYLRLTLNQGQEKKCFNEFYSSMIVTRVSTSKYLSSDDCCFFVMTVAPSVACSFLNFFPYLLLKLAKKLLLARRLVVIQFFCNFFSLL